MERRASLTAAWIALGLVGLNFVLDYADRRGSDLQSPTAKRQDGAKQSAAETEAARQWLFEARDHLKALEGRIDQFEMAIERPHPPPPKDGLRTEALGEGKRGGSDEDKDAAEQPTLGHLTLPIEKLKADWKRFQEDAFIKKFESIVDNPQRWKAEELVPKLEEEFGAQLASESKEVLAQLLEHYRQLAHVAFGAMEAERHLLIADALLEGRYVVPGPDGAYPPNRPGVFMSFSVGTKKFTWTSEEAPELYRLWTTFQHLPLAMIDEARRFIEEKKK